MTAATAPAKTTLHNGEVNGVNFTNGVTTMMQPVVYAPYTSQQFYPPNSSANGTAQSSMCSTPASASAAAAAAIAAATMLNGQQNSIKFQQQTALQYYYNTNSASSSLIPVIQGNNDVNAISHSTLTPVEFHPFQQQLAANLEPNNNLSGYVNINGVYCPTTSISQLNNNNGLLSALPYQPQQEQQPQASTTTVFAIPKIRNVNIPNQAISYEGLPIFLIPQAGSLSVNAFQRANEFKLAQLTGGLLSSTLAITPKIDTSKHFHVFVGDLSPEVNNEMLKEVFDKCGNISEAKVIRDPQSLKSRGYGFVSFPDKQDAQKAIDEMNNVMIGRRAVRTNWASRRAATTLSNGASDDEKFSTTTGSANERLTLEKIMNATDNDNTTVYLGNLNVTMTATSNSNDSGNETNKGFVTEEEIRNAFYKFGEIKEIRLFSAQNYGFVIFAKKECAAIAIFEMNNKELIPGRQSIKCSWGRASVTNGLTAMQDNNNTLATAQLIAAQLAATQTNQTFSQNANAFMALAQQSDAMKQWQVISNANPYLQQQAAIQQMIAASNLTAVNANTSLLTSNFCNTSQIDAMNGASLYGTAQPGIWHA